MTALRSLIFGLSALGLGGCATVRHAAPPSATVPVTVTSKAVAASDDRAILPSPPEPVYHNPKISVVYLRAYEDAQGRLLGPQIMYQVTDPGGWNIDAVQDGNGYIPAVNVEVPPGMPSAYAAPAREVKAAPLDRPLLDPEEAARIVLTGLMRREDRPQAEAMARAAGAGFTAVFDPEAGWLVVPPGPKEPGP
jgi:hypothetical protein